MKQLTLSIVIPAYNEAQHIEECLEAIAAQTEQPDEVIVVDNNSTDNTAKLARKFPFVRVISEKHQGRVFARDAGFNAATRDIIARMDGDTMVPPDWVAHIKAFYKDAAHSKMAFSGGASFYNVRFPRAVAWLYNFMAFDFNHMLIGHPTLWGSNMAITRDQWQSVKGHICARNDIHEDLDLSIHLYRQGCSIFYDRRFRIGAHMRRVHSDRHDLWQYLQWWPRTLRVHGKESWVICWLLGAAVMYGLAMVLVGVEYIARLLGRQPFEDDTDPTTVG